MVGVAEHSKFASPEDQSVRRWLVEIRDWGRIKFLYLDGCFCKVGIGNLVEYVGHEMGTMYELRNLPRLRWR